MNERITIGLSDIGVALNAINRHISDVERRAAELTRRLADIGLQEANVRLTGAMYDGINDTLLSVEPTERGWQILASGQAICFIEFGAGVYYNGFAGTYPIERPPGIVGIGEYGRGQGAHNGWVYIDADGERQFTRGNPAAMPMYHATEEMRSQLLSIAREVFGV